jgi:hypothetical protein
MIKVEDLKNIKLPKFEDIDLNNLEFKKNEAEAELKPKHVDSEFDIILNFKLKNDNKDIKAESSMTLFEKDSKKIFKKFLFKETALSNVNDYFSFLEDIPKKFKNFIKKNLGTYNRIVFKNNWANKRATIIDKTLQKLKKSKEDNKDKMTKDDVEKAIFDFVDRHEIENENYAKKIKLNNEKHDILRNIYLNGEVKQLYTYGTLKFGFITMDLRFDVSAGFADIKKIK